MDENAQGSLVSKCSCENQDSLTSETKEQKRRSFSLGFFNLRKSQSLNLQGSSKKSKRTNWIMKLNCTKNGEGDADNHEVTSSDCHCTCYKQGDESDLKISASVLDVVEISEFNTIEPFPNEPVEPQQSIQNEVPVASLQEVEVVAALPEATTPEAALPEAELPGAELSEVTPSETTLSEATPPEATPAEAVLSETAQPEAAAVTPEVAALISEVVAVTTAATTAAESAPAVVPPAEAVEVVVVEEPIVAALNEPNEANGGNGIYNRGVYSNSSGNIVLSASFFDANWLRSFHEDCDEAARLQRAREIEQGVEAPPNFKPMRRVQLLYSDVDSDSGQVPRRLQLVCSSDLTVDSLCAFFQNRITLRSCPIDSVTGCHTQIDFIHCLVPDLLNITNCSFYWGKMNRYEAERLLEGKPEGTFLLRDSAQEEFLFSVSFRKYNRSLHARIEQWNHKFSFDSHDPGVYTSDTVCGLIEHYKDPSSCMFFEPMLTWPLHRNFTFSLQHICRAAIVSRLSYDDISTLQLPKSLKSYLKEYHYRQKVRVERFEDDVQWIDLRSVPP